MSQLIMETWKHVNNIPKYEKVGWQRVFCESWTNSPPPYSEHDQIRRCWLYSGGTMPDWWAGSGVGKYVQCREPKKRTAKVRRNILPIWVWLIYAPCSVTIENIGVLTMKLERQQNILRNRVGQFVLFHEFRW